jgi:hypothetical protein
VGGTLTVSGAGSSTVAGKLVVNPLIAATKSVEIQIAHAINTENYLRVASDNGSSFGAEYGYGLTGVGDPEIRINRLHAGTVTNVLKIRTTNGAATLAGSLSITDTTASTTTSSGALVVGNGTSGGLGVGGAGYFGGVLNISSTAGLYAQWKKTDNASGSQSWAWILNNDGTLFLQAANDNFVGANNYISFARSGVTPGTTTIHGTTASTSTSSGALVVSGGVGVAGSIYAGAGGSTHIFTGGDGGSGSTLFALKDLGGTTRVNVSGTGEVGIGVNLILSGSSNVFRINNAQTPASAGATGTAGTICWDTSYIYVCTATNTWKRVAISTW